MRGSAACVSAARRANSGIAALQVHTFMLGRIEHVLKPLASGGQQRYDDDDEYWHEAQHEIEAVADLSKVVVRLVPKVVPADCEDPQTELYDQYYHKPKADGVHPCRVALLSRAEAHL